MVSYQTSAFEASELLHEELALRGFSVFHDKCSFPLGIRIERNMSDAVRLCHVFVGYLTESALYPNSLEGSRRPVLDAEFKPIMERWRDASSAGKSVDVGPRPVVLILTHGLGDPRTEAPERIRKATGEDISSLWNPITLDQTTSGISQPEAAAAAACVLGAIFAPGGVSATDQPIDLSVVTRGQGQPLAFLTVDATALVGGPASRSGDPSSWIRYLAGISDLQVALAKWSRNRHLRIMANAHISACIALGRVFNQAAGWQLTVVGRFGESNFRAYPHPDSRLAIVTDLVGGPGDITVEIDLVGAGVTRMATEQIAAFDQSPRGRLQIHLKGSEELKPEQIAAAAAESARHIRRFVADLRPERAHVFCASPADFAVLMSSRLTSLHTDLCLYERHDGSYVSSIVIPRSLP